MDQSSRQKINKETLALNDTLHQRDIIDMCRAFHPKAAEYTFFLSAHGTFSRIDHMLGHKTRLDKLRKIKIISRDLPGGAVVKDLPANAGDTGSIPGPGRSHMLQSN